MSTKFIRAALMLFTALLFDDSIKACLPPPAGIVDFWPADGNASDIVGTNNGTILYGVSYAAGEVGSAFSFNGAGAGGVVQVNGSPIPPPWTAECWVNRQASPQDSAVLIGDSATALKLEQYQNTKDVGFTIWNVQDYTFHYSAPTNTWVHLAFVATTTNIELYVNGVFTDSNSTTMNLPRGQIGNDITNRYNKPLNGLLDELSLYNRALTPSEIASIYAAGSAGKCRTANVQFTANPTNGGVPLTVNFSSPSVDSWGYPIVSWNWDFGDSTTSTAQNPSHTYTWGQTFYPSLLATNSIGVSVVGEGPSIDVTNPPCTPPSDVSIVFDYQTIESDGIHLFFHVTVGIGTPPFTFQWNPPYPGEFTNLVSFSDSNDECEVVLNRTGGSEAIGFTVLALNNCGSGLGNGGTTACGTCLSPDEPNLLAAGAGAGTGPTKTNLCGITSINTRWYEMQAGNSGPITVGTVGSSNLNQLAVYSGISFASLTYMGCTTNRPARITFNATSNAVYYFALDPGTNNASNLGLTYGYEPPIENYTLTKGTFALQSGVAPPLGYQVLASTNLTLNVSNWSVVLTTNWSLSNSNYFNYRLNYVETNMNKFPRRFYRLAP